MNAREFPHDSADLPVVGPDRMCNTAWARSDAARPIVPMRPDRTDPGAARFPLRATARATTRAPWTPRCALPLARDGERVHHSLVHVLHAIHAIHVNLMEE